MSVLFVSVVGLCCVVNGVRNVLSCPCPNVLLGEPVWTPCVVWFVFVVKEQKYLVLFVLLA